MIKTKIAIHFNLLPDNILIFIEHEKTHEIRRSLLSKIQTQNSSSLNKIIDPECEGLSI